MLIKVCNGNGCKDRFRDYIIERLRSDIERFELKNVTLEETPCMNMCDKGPIVRIDKQILEYATPIKASEMMFKKLNKKNDTI